MAGSPYASALGRLEPEFPAFLSKEMYATLLHGKDYADLAKLLETTPYADSIVQARTTHPGASMVEIAINRTFVRRNRRAYEATPYAGRRVVAAYLGRWDIQNIELILSSKVNHRPVTETEDHLVSSRDIPAGLYAGVMTLDDFRLLLSQPSVEATVAALTQFGYGATVLPFLEAFERTHDIFPILAALDRQYYQDVGSAARFFQGDEWVVRGLLASEIDVRNALLLLKAKRSDLPWTEVGSRWIPGGSLREEAAADLYAARGVPELAERLAERFPSVVEGTEEFRAAGNLSGYEAALQRDRAARELKRLRTYPLSLAVIFAYLLRSEVERGDLRRLAFGRLYGLSVGRLEKLLVAPAL
ncbi:MAG TPA: V-type ATPase subunit [Thermoplasmata archaeon]|nr:V-type ATPase subunit [Thermoplasmata archaeon]